MYANMRYAKLWLMKNMVIPILYVILHIKIIDEQRVTELCVTHCLIQGEA